MESSFATASARRPRRASSRRPTSTRIDVAWRLGYFLSVHHRSTGAQVHASIRAWLATNVSPAIAKATRIQYGGSMKGANAAGLLSKPDIDGGLIGGASLKAEFISGIAAVAPKP